VSGQLDGKAIALGLAGDGARVVVNHLNTPELAEAVVAQITRDGGEAITVVADVGKRVEYTAMVDLTIDRFGSWDILFNNAGSRSSSRLARSPRRSSKQLPGEREGLLQRLPGSPLSAWPTVGESSTSPARRPA
jgi:NAD(P)-dependent dehydrogenase (short-subunit alcohol dehydrogenase family)